LKAESTGIVNPFLSNNKFAKESKFAYNIEQVIEGGKYRHSKSIFKQQQF
jgi:hypothetical protein